MIELSRVFFLTRLLCFITGIIWIFLLPFNYFNKETYISENAILPGSVNTYFGGSDNNVLQAYRDEIEFISKQSKEMKIDSLNQIFRRLGLRTATQDYMIQFKGRNYSGTNFYAVFDTPKGDGTEALILSAAWKDMNGNRINKGGISLVLALARYFKRWSLWSKDIIFLIPEEKEIGVQVWIDAYHRNDYEKGISRLVIKGGEIQAVVDIDFVSEFREFDTIEILYDGINGQLSNLDLLNTINRIILSKSGIKINMQNVLQQRNSYFQKLSTMINGMINQCLGVFSGTQSYFIPYKIDAITLKVLPKENGKYNDMLLGEIIESLFRSLNNLLEHLHQSFFFYFMLSVKRFVSIGIYLPSAILIASSFTIDALGLWFFMFLDFNKKLYSIKKDKSSNSEERENKLENIKMDLVSSFKKQAVLSVFTVIIIHVIAFIFLKILYDSADHKGIFKYKKIYLIFLLFLQVFQNLIFIFIQGILKKIIKEQKMSFSNNYKLNKIFSQIILGIELSTLAIVNFSLSLFIGIITFPLSFVRPAKTKAERIYISIALEFINPLNWIGLVSYYKNKEIIDLVHSFALGWKLWYLWTPVVLWLLWWPMWIMAKIILYMPVNDYNEIMIQSPKFLKNE
ncbi:hypothetical protein PORY_000951 [Pneumocystis oryctolagi]|uniref:Uncharacterized protein n=1 Tax=Pneumocystis oryctolagi TaxID=42067 RepID=A0ACB7CEA5_9ASCO|nr:hypothetical protein PORY_000951 [Pneumocystis oryctolagi]